MGVIRTKAAIGSELESASQRYRTLFHHTHEGVYVIGADGRIIDANPALLNVLGFRRSGLLGKHADVLLADARERARMRALTAADGPLEDIEVRLLREDGRELVCLVTLAAERSGVGELTACQVIVHDITGRHPDEERLRHAALHDSLTRLPNRRFLDDRLARLIERPRHRPDFAVLVIDVDRFRLVNDSMGHRAGDELLTMVAERLTTLVRPEDILARVGGDEFAVILVDLEDVNQGRALCARIQEALVRPFQVLGKDVYVGASIGIALSGPRRSTAEHMLRDAEIAMYGAKKDGRGWAVFDEAMHRRAVDLLESETALRRGLERREFVLHYQPLISMATGQLLGFEALLRWAHPVRGLLAPAEFLSLAEESGLIVPLGDWVLREACRTAAAWRAESRSHAGPPLVSVNLSGRQLTTPGLAHRIREILDANGLPGSALRLEITESVLLKRSDAVLQTLGELSALGTTLCLDNFGTGYPSLGNLRDLPLHALKIDRSFVSQLTGHGGPQLVQTILFLARQLGLGAVVEGVETEGQMENLLRLGCDDAQGFLFSSPVEAEQASAWVRTPPNPFTGGRGMRRWRSA